MKQYISFSFMAMLLLSLHHLQDSEAAVQCSDVLKDLSPCSGYLSTGSGSPSTACCGGLSALVSAAASTTADRRAACSCILSAVSQKSPNVTAAAALPGICGVTLPFPISASIDCSKYTNSKVAVEKLLD